MHKSGVKKVESSVPSTISRQLLTCALHSMFYADALTLPLHASTYSQCLRLVSIYHPYRIPFPPSSSSSSTAIYNLAIAVVLTLSSFGEYRLHPQLIKHEYRLLCNATTFEKLLDQESNGNNEGSNVQEIAQRMLCIKILGSSMVCIEPGDTT